MGINTMNQSLSISTEPKRSAPRLLCVMIGVALGSLSASSWSAAVANSTKTASAVAETNSAESSNKADTITVVGTPDTFRAGGNDLIPTYLDGQVANGGRIGFLGQQDARNVPFNIIGYTSKMIEDQQAATIADVVKNDASVQTCGVMVTHHRITVFVVLIWMATIFHSVVYLVCYRARLFLPAWLNESKSLKELMPLLTVSRQVAVALEA